MRFASFIAFSATVLGFAKAHREPITALAAVLTLFGLTTAGILLPEAHHRATPACLAVLGAFFSGVLAEKRIG